MQGGPTSAASKSSCSFLLSSCSLCLCGVAGGTSGFLKPLGQSSGGDDRTAGRGRRVGNRSLGTGAVGRPTSASPAVGRDPPSGSPVGLDLAFHVHVDTGASSMSMYETAAEEADLGNEEEQEEALLQKLSGLQ